MSCVRYGTWASRWRNDPPRRRSVKSIAAGVMRAAARINSLVDAEPEYVSLNAARHALRIAGIKPATDPQMSVNFELKAGYVIDLSKHGPTYRDSMSGTQVNEIKDITPGSRT